MSHHAIIVEDVYKSYGEVKALNGVSLTAPAGRVLGLLGPNGAGKTTLVRILTTLLQPDSGHVEVEGINVLQQPDQVRSVIGLAGQYPAVDEQLTGRENLVMVGQLYHMGGRDAKARAKELLRRFTLDDAADRPVKTYSGGMRRRLDLAASIVSNPRVLFLDEPTTGLDPRTRIDLWNFIRELVNDGTTLLLTTQYLEEADELADRIVVIDDGRAIAEGTADELKTRLASDVVQLSLTSDTDQAMVLKLLENFGRGELQFDQQTGVIRVPVDDGARSLIEIVRVLDREQIDVDDIALRRPTLDDVFLSLTERADETEINAEPTA